MNARSLPIGWKFIKLPVKLAARSCPPGADIKYAINAGYHIRSSESYVNDSEARKVIAVIVGISSTLVIGAHSRLILPPL